MFIKNYSDSDLTVNYKGERYTLPANDVSYVDNSWISYSMLKVMFGDYIYQVTPTTPIEEFLFDNQILAVANKRYLTRLIGPGLPNIFVKGGKVNIYFDDGEDIPASKTDMSLFTEYTNFEGFKTFDAMPKYALFEVASGSPEVVLTNIEITELT